MDSLSLCFAIIFEIVMLGLGVDRFSSSSTLNMASHSLLASIVSDEKLALNLVGVSFYVMTCFSLPAFKIFSFAFQHFCTSTTIMCLDVDLCIYPTWSSTNFLNVYINVFCQIWIVFSQYLLEYLVCHISIWYSQYVVLVHLTVSHFSEALFIFHFSSSSFSSSSSFFFYLLFFR